MYIFLNNVRPQGGASLDRFPMNRHLEKGTEFLIGLLWLIDINLKGLRDYESILVSAFFKLGDCLTFYKVFYFFF